ncbi:DUF488 domain-containing protein [Leptolyngbya sp. GB1-A1]|uniref:DUF488 domain-containing protein n=1 Tax=Leptolyngbya sp. GB1-A1 TaxID=2933908 RepID=UPI003296E671
MLNRQKALLMILQQIGGTASSVQMMKWAFLLSCETPSHGGKTFYQFIPYRYGPYSFTLNQETDSLIRNGFLEKGTDNRWRLTPLGESLDVTLPSDVSKDICQIIATYGKLSGQKLINLIYDKYSWFTINSELPGRRKEKRPVAKRCIYTAGYEGKTVDEFLNLLMESGISRLIDVRHNPISRRYGFHKSTLSRLCSSLNIDYQHFPGLGIPGSERECIGSENQYITLFENYRLNLSSCEKDLANVIRMLQSEPSVLVCMEANPNCCHRNVLAQHLAISIDMSIKHLGYST